ncbi:MAG: transposase [Bacillota bacterium]
MIDDTVVRKTGKKMAGLGWHYSHADQQQVWGHSYVTAHYVIAGYAYPVGVLYQSQRACSQSGSEFRSKLELAAQLIADFTPVPGTRPVVLFDSWYASSTLIQVALGRDFGVVCAVRRNLVLHECPHAPPARGISLAELATRTGMPDHLVTVNHRTYRVRHVDGYLKGNLRARIVMSAAPSHGARFYAHFHPRQEAFSTMDAQELLTHYSHGWPVETFHRNARQLLGFDDYRVRSAGGIERYLELVLIAYTLAETQRVLLASRDTDQPPPTLGDVCRQSPHHA